MTIESGVYRRILRRQTHSSRSLPAIVVASAVALLLLALLVAGVWRSLDPAFRLNLDAAALAAARAAQSPAVQIASGAALVLLALPLLVLALAPGRRARRARIGERAALVIDDGVIADSVAEAVSRRAGVSRGQVGVTVGRRTVSVRITPTSGSAIDRDAAVAASEDTLRGIRFPASTRVAVATEGVVG